jgi:hypothetical protein
MMLNEIQHVGTGGSGSSGGGGGGGSSFVERAADFTHWACLTHEGLHELFLDLNSQLNSQPETEKLSCTSDRVKEKLSRCAEAYDRFIFNTLQTFLGMFTMNESPDSVKYAFTRVTNWVYGAYAMSHWVDERDNADDERPLIAYEVTHDGRLVAAGEQIHRGSMDPLCTLINLKREFCHAFKFALADVFYWILPKLGNEEEDDQAAFRDLIVMLHPGMANMDLQTPAERRREIEAKVKAAQEARLREEKESLEAEVKRRAEQRKASASSTKKKDESMAANECGYCGSTENVMKYCSRCHLVYYCSQSCQAADWKKEHKLKCVSLAMRIPDKSGGKMAKTDPCVICYETLQTRGVAELKCGHQLHASCLKELQNSMSANQSCPLCRAPL